MHHLNNHLIIGFYLTSVDSCYRLKVTKKRRNINDLEEKKTLRGGIRRVLVELMVIETTTSSMRTKRSTN